MVAGPVLASNKTWSPDSSEILRTTYYLGCSTGGHCHCITTLIADYVGREEMGKIDQKILRGHSCVSSFVLDFDIFLGEFNFLGKARELPSLTLFRNF